MTVAVVVELLRASALLVFALTSLALDSKSNWLEGAVLCGVCAFVPSRCPCILLLAGAADRAG